MSGITIYKLSWWLHHEWSHKLIILMVKEMTMVYISRELNKLIFRNLEERIWTYRMIIIDTGPSYSHSIYHKLWDQYNFFPSFEIFEFIITNRCKIITYILKICRIWATWIAIFLGKVLFFMNGLIYILTANQSSIICFSKIILIK